MFKSHILKYRVGIVSMLVVMTCMIVCSVLFDASGSVHEGEPGDVAIVRVEAGDPGEDTVIAPMVGVTGKEITPDGISSGEVIPEGQQDETEQKSEPMEDPVVVAEGDLAEQIVGEILSQ